MIYSRIIKKEFSYFRQKVYRNGIHSDFYPFPHRGDGFARFQGRFNLYVASYYLYGDEVIRETILFLNNEGISAHFRPIVDII